jgi:hypothetical protein
MWRSEARGRTGKPTKIPYCPRQPERRADTTDPTTWARRDEAEDAARRCLNGAGGGVGIVLGDLGTDHYLAGLDLDGSVDDGRVSDWAAELLEAVPSYAEVSPSQTGIKVFFRLRAAAVRPLLDRLEASGWGLKRGIPGLSGAAHGPGVELYTAARFFTVTGQHWGRSPARIALLGQEAIDALVSLIPSPPPAGNQGSAGSDSSRSAKAFREAIRLKRQGCTLDELREALSNHADPEIAAWMREKGLVNKEREFQRLWLRAGKTAPGGVPTIRVIAGERHLAADAGLAALARAGTEFYHRDQTLVRVGLTSAKTSYGDDIMLPGIAPVTPRAWRARSGLLPCGSATICAPRAGCEPIRQCWSASRSWRWPTNGRSRRWPGSSPVPRCDRTARCWPRPDTTARPGFILLMPWPCRRSPSVRAGMMRERPSSCFSIWSPSSRSSMMRARASHCRC